MKKVIALVLIAMFAFVAIGCGDDDEGGGCNEDNVQACFDDYTTCTEGLDPMGDTYMDDLDACLDDYCNCLEATGCDIPDGAGC